MDGRDIFWWPQWNRENEQNDDWNIPMDSGCMTDRRIWWIWLNNFESLFIWKEQFMGDICVDIGTYSRWRDRTDTISLILSTQFMEDDVVHADIFSTFPLLGIESRDNRQIWYVIHGMLGGCVYLGYGHVGLVSPHEFVWRRGFLRS